MARDLTPDSQQFQNALILMGDIIGSRHRNQSDTMGAFRKIVNELNSALSDRLLSPLTITLGDEFQGIVRDVASGVDALIRFEEALVHDAQDFKMNYVLLEGKIETPVNPEVAHGMMGEGLTRARENLTKQKKSGAGRFQINLPDEDLSQNISLAFTLYQSIVDDWDPVRDFGMVSAFLNHDDYKDVAIVTGKTRSQSWKRERSLKITPYKSARALLLRLAEHVS